MAEQDKANITSNLTADTSNKVQTTKKQSNKLKSSTVKDVISKTKTLTGSRPDQININPVQEAKEKSAVFAFGRFNPPTTGHEKLIHKVEATAKSHGADAHIIASHSEGSGKNPLPKEKKVGYLKKVASSSTHVSSSDKENPSFLQQAKKLHDAGYHHLVMVAGSDRVDDYHKKLHQYNGKEGHYNFKSIKVVSAGQRDPDAEGTAGMSGTKMREHARSGNMKSFKSGLPKALHSHADEIADHIRSVKEDVADIDDTSGLLDIIENVHKNITDKLFVDAVKTAEKKLKNQQQNNYFKALNLVHYNRITKNEKKAEKEVKEEIMNTASGGTVRGLGFVTGSPDADSPSYVTNNIADADTKDNILKQLKTNMHDKLHTKAVKEDIDSMFTSVTEKFGKEREAVARSGQDRKKLDYTVRKDVDRKEDDRPYRQQAIQKNIIDEKYGKGYKSPWEKIEKAKPGIGKRIDAAAAGLKQNAKDYQDIVDKEKKEVKEATTTADIPVWEKPGPKGKSKKLSSVQKARAKARARAAGRPYPNLIDNMAVAKEEVIHELSNELIGKVNKIRTLTGAKSKTAKASETLNKAVEKVRSRTDVGKVK